MYDKQYPDIMLTQAGYTSAVASKDGPGAGGKHMEGMSNPVWTVVVIIVGSCGGHGAVRKSISWHASA